MSSSQVKKHPPACRVQVAIFRPENEPADFGIQPTDFNFISMFPPKLNKIKRSNSLNRLVSKYSYQNVMGNNQGHCRLRCIVIDSVIKWTHLS